MASSTIRTLSEAEREAQGWLDHIAAEMSEHHRHRAYSAFRATMHALRDCLPYDDVMVLGEALPAILRGVLLEGWHPARAGRAGATQDAFLAHVAEYLLGVTEMPPQHASGAVFAVLHRRAGRPLPPSLDRLRPEGRSAVASPSDAEEAREDIRTALERAQAEGVPPGELPELRDDLQRPRGGRLARPAETEVLQTSLQKTRAWARELDAALRLGDPDVSFAALCAVLQALRDRLSRDEAFHLASQLPLVLVGFFFETRPDAAALKERSRGEFLGRVSRNVPDLQDFRPEEAARAVFGLLSEHVTEGELKDVRGRLPAPVRALWPSETDRPRPKATAGRGSSRARPGSRARARRAKREVRSTLAKARARGVPEKDLPVLLPRRRR
ncbi:MAG TPA: DUF2267 domain-containing protein [Planctomycetota bacterium]|nr:DUF2267 domain-containing protein [Planctomycetota bacterium]